MKKWLRKSTKIILDDKRLRVKEDIVQLPNKKLKSLVYWDSNDSAMVVGMTSDKKLIMIRQYRYMVDDEVIEFPSGLLYDNEDTTAAAKREFKEEAGYDCNELIKLGSFYETYGQLNRQIHMFFSKNVKKSSQNLDQGKRGYEEINVMEIEFDKVIKLALQNKIVAMGSSLAILLLNEKINRGEIKI